MRTQMHTSHVYGCQRAITATPFYWLLCERICDMEAHMLRLTLFHTRKTRKRQKDEGFARLKSSICDVFLSELYVCPPAEI